MWFETNKTKLLAEYGDSCEEAELTVKAMHQYRQLIKVNSKHFICISNLSISNISSFLLIGCTVKANSNGKKHECDSSEFYAENLKHLAY